MFLNYVFVEFPLTRACLVHGSEEWKLTFHLFNFSVLCLNYLNDDKSRIKNDFNGNENSLMSENLIHHN